MSDTRSCTCHPNEAPNPCPQKYALTSCLIAAYNQLAQSKESLGREFENVWDNNSDKLYEE